MKILLLSFFIIFSILGANAQVNTPKTQCQGTTAKGAQCTRKISNGSYCYQHLNIHDNSKTVVAPTDTTAKTQCTAITKKGTRCRRTANSITCFQHSKPAAPRSR